MILYTAGAEVEYKLQLELTKYTPYLALTVELWGVFCEDFGETIFTWSLSKVLTDNFQIVVLYTHTYKYIYIIVSFI